MICIRAATILVICIVNSNALATRDLDPKRDAKKPALHGIDQGNGLARNFRELRTQKKSSILHPSVEGRAASDCPHGFAYLSGTNKCYFLVQYQRNWEDSRRNCKNFNRRSRLLTIYDQREQDAIVSSFLYPRIDSVRRHCGLGGGSLFAIWTSGQRVTTSPQSNTWAWKPDSWYYMGHSNWHPGEPNNDHGQGNCMNLLGNHFAWNDAPCDVISCSVCEVDLN